jgi:hypothetical protein
VPSIYYPYRTYAISPSRDQQTFKRHDYLRHPIITRMALMCALMFHIRRAERPNERKGTMQKKTGCPWPLGGSGNQKSSISFGVVVIHTRSLRRRILCLIEDSLGATPPNTRFPPSACSAQIPCKARHRNSEANGIEVCEHAVFVIVLSGFAG